MDGRRFDDLARTLGRSTSRRRAVGALALAAVSGLGSGRAAPASAQAPQCGTDDHGTYCGGCGICRRSGKHDWLGRGTLTCEPAPWRCMDEATTTDDSCPDCNPATMTCTPSRTCGPCESCIQNRTPSCDYSPYGRDGQCPDPATAPCMRATGECGCDDPLIYCDPDCVDPRSDKQHCGGCHRRCNACEKCRDGRCVRCDRTCEKCTGGDCVSTCTGQCFTVCKNAKCVEPDPPVCVCGEPGAGQPPAAKRVYLPVVGLQGGDTPGVEPCGEGDQQQCCVPEECMAASEGGRVCCGADGVCGDLCCKFGEQCTTPGCCCPQSLVDISGRCVQCL